MSVGPLGGMVPSVSGTPGAQRAGSAQEQAAQESTAASTQRFSQQKAEAAQGVGATEAEDQSPHERDADGRRPWEEPPEAQATEENSPASDSPPASPHDGQLDLMA